MHDLDLRHVPDREGGAAHPLAPLDVFAVHEEAAVEEADPADRRGARDHARAAHPIDRHRLRAADEMPLIDDEAAAPPRRERGQKEEVTDTRPGGGGEPRRAGLQPPVRQTQRRSDDGHLGSTRHGRDQREDPGGANHRVAVHQGDVRRRVFLHGQPDALVASAGEADVLLVRDELDPRELPHDQVHATVGRPVVDTDDLHALGGTLRRQRGQAFTQQILRIPAHHDGADVPHHAGPAITTPPALRWRGARQRSTPATDSARAPGGTPP